MKYFQLYGDTKRNFFLYCGIDGKFYEYKPKIASNKLVGKYLILFTIVSILLRYLDTVFQDLLNPVLCVVLVLFAAVFSILIGAKIFQINTIKNQLNLQEISLTKEQIEKYIFDGKKQFIKQLCIIYFFITLAIFAFGFFIYIQEVTLLIGGMLIVVGITFLIMTATPLKKYRFFKDKKQN
ncbi:MAG: hypothetical protein IKJ68_11700 [Clostridia bacterium]|nr:hypothetical protein [Clostridia bacterium]